MAHVKIGDTVRVHYTGSLADGTVFDTSYDRTPLEFTVGDKTIIAGFEEAVVGMSTGEKKKFELSADQAYGERSDEMIYTMDRNALPGEIEPQVGMVLQASFQNGQVTDVQITDVTEDTVTLDANHPLAGKSLHFELELMERDEA
ncbi:peptidylprolyl isomerase [Desulfurispirillum indicum]|uniref:Peptidyl-prolyl cis-trans isomerase n=1 Tax=Desulfurispirillum indicum (strain ATCC BAA-1389 / DSM 22839 / S5) TaxID=653733 RepID=E6W6L3_DESIS|nr:peptidylprolyl isomerase [Desulfurispirillum indicum]ADU65013.1 peptidylprolyl isomerase FKBP-type [Desulfurispirillum indicum S5]UCZ56916.1 peptidylprolyl isomerase [Desulfurispirillum indicum]